LVEHCKEHDDCNKAQYFLRLLMSRFVPSKSTRIAPHELGEISFMDDTESYIRAFRAKFCRWPVRLIKDNILSFTNNLPDIMGNHLWLNAETFLTMAELYAATLRWEAMATKGRLLEQPKALETCWCAVIASNRPSGCNKLEEIPKSALSEVCT
jgi:hypothetical protein